MADIVYNIQIDGNGNVTVTQDVKAVMTPDNATFISNRDDTVVRFPGVSPFKTNGGPKADELFPVGKQKGPFAIENGLGTAPLKNVPGFGMRRTFHFDCGVKDPTTGKFVPWGGGGLELPSGGG